MQIYSMEAQAELLRSPAAAQVREVARALSKSWVKHPSQIALCKRAQALVTSPVVSFTLKADDISQIKSHEANRICPAWDGSEVNSLDKCFLKCIKISK